MTCEELFFIQVLSDHLAGRLTKVPQDVDWVYLAKLSNYHEVDGIVYSQCKKTMPREMAIKYERATQKTLFYYINRMHALQEISSALQKESIPWFTVKGFSIAQYYPIPALRTMGDCDLIIKPEDLNRTISILRDLGFEGDELSNGHEWKCVRNELYFELHDKLIQEGEYTTRQQEKFFDNYFGHVRDGVLDWNYHFLYLLMHIRKHFINYGIGIRQFMDVAVIIQNGPMLKWDWIEKKLKELNLLKFAHVCYALIAYWFDINIDIRYEPLEDSFRETVTGIILTNGVFGFNNVDNMRNIEKNSLIIPSSSRVLNRALVLSRAVFLPYQYMIKNPGYDYLNGKKYLLPVAWIHRIVRSLTNKDKSSIVKAAMSYSFSKDDLDERKELFINMGLL